MSYFQFGNGKGIFRIGHGQGRRKSMQQTISYQVGPRRPGDIAVCYSDAQAALTEMNWQATRNLDDMCRDLWNWQSKNPSGYTNDKDDDKESSVEPVKNKM